MSRFKKILLGSIIAITMSIAFVAGAVGFGGKSSPANTIKVDKAGRDPHASVQTIKPSTYSFKPGEVSIQRGGDSLNYSYNPHTSMGDAPASVAYEYIFSNPMDRVTAISLKEIDTTDVNIWYAWDYAPITSLSSIDASANYTCQKLQKNGEANSKIYIYVIVSPTNLSIPVTFTSSIKWYYGIPCELPVVNNVTGEATTQTIVTGQSIDKNTLTAPESFVKDEDGTEVTYYFDAWFLDKEYTQLVESDEVKPSKQIYARYHNFPMYTNDYTSFKNGGYTITGDPEILNLILPALYNDGVNGYAPIVAIDAFDSSSLVSIDLNACTSLTSIGEYVFAWCENLVSVNISNCTNLTSIGDFAFAGCYSLTSIVLPNGLKTIGAEAFGECLKYVAIPASVTSIDNEAFLNSPLVEIYNQSNCYVDSRLSLLQEYSNPSESKFITIDGVRYYKESNSSYMAAYLEDATKTSVTLDSRTTSIYECAFEHSNLISVDLSNCTNLINIGEDAFGYCESLTSIDLSGCISLTSIGNRVFEGCSGLTSVDLSGCTSLTSIEDGAFGGCESLTSITLPSSLTSIGGEAFSYCESLTSIVIPASVTKIGGYAFDGCNSLTSLTFEVDGTWYYGTGVQQGNMSGGTKFEIVAGTDYSEAFTDTYYSKFWYKK